MLHESERQKKLARYDGSNLSCDPRQTPPAPLPLPARAQAAFSVWSVGHGVASSRRGAEYGYSYSRQREGSQGD